MATKTSDSLSVSTAWDDISNIRHFFSLLLPAIIRQRQALFLSQKGSLSIAVQGAGCWTVYFGNEHTPLVEEFFMDADLVATFSLAAFTSLLTRKTEEKTTFQRSRQEMEGLKEIATLGDSRMLTRFGRLLEAPTSNGYAQITFLSQKA